MNRNYFKGRDKEYRIKRMYEKKGHIVLRTAGSHGFADLIAIHPQEKAITFIQCKPKALSEASRKALLESWLWLNGQFSVTFVVE